MAQTKKKRKRKQRGTQAGSIDTRRKARPKNRAEARAQAKSGKGKSRASSVIDRPPTWRGAFIRGLIAAGVFVAVVSREGGNRPKGRRRGANRQKG